MTYHLYRESGNKFRYIDIKPVGSNNWSIDESLLYWLKQNIPKNSAILEFGSGAATDVLSKHFRMISVEDQTGFLDKYNTEYIHAPLVDGWYDLSILEQKVFPRKDYQCILVDGPCRKSGRRSVLLDHIDKLDQSAVLIIDDIFDEDGLYQAILERRQKQIAFVHEGNKWAAIWPTTCALSQILWPRNEDEYN